MSPMHSSTASRLSRETKSKTWAVALGLGKVLHVNRAHLGFVKSITMMASDRTMR